MLGFFNTLKIHMYYNDYMKIYRSTKLNYTADQIWNILMRLDPKQTDMEVYLVNMDNEIIIVGDLPSTCVEDPRNNDQYVCLYDDKLPIGIS